MNFDHETSINWRKLLSQTSFLGLELGLATVLYAIISENIAQFSTGYLSEVPLIGSAFEAIAPEATPSHIIAVLLAFFIIAVPLYIWTYILSEKVLLDPQEWLSKPPNQIIASFAAFVLLLVVSLESINLYTLIVKQSVPAGGFLVTQQSDLLSFISENKALAIGISATLTIMNLVISLLTANAFLTKD